mgnify:CR=1 FL=1
MTVTKVCIRTPRNWLEGWEGRIYTNDGKVHRVRAKELVEPYDIGGEFQWDYFPFETEAACKAATIRQAKRMGWKPAKVAA